MGSLERCLVYVYIFFSHHHNTYSGLLVVSIESCMCWLLFYLAHQSGRPLCSDWIETSGCRALHCDQVVQYSVCNQTIPAPASWLAPSSPTLLLPQSNSSVVCQLLYILQISSLISMVRPEGGRGAFGVLLSRVSNRVGPVSLFTWFFVNKNFM